MKKPLITPVAFVALAGLSLLCRIEPALAGSDWYVGQKVSSGQRISTDAVDHRLWDQLLSKHVDDRGRVDYRAWKASSSDRMKLDAYLDELSRADRSKSASRSARLAFWINAYNAVTIKGILREYPTPSIREHTARFFGYNIWEDLKLHVDGDAYSLKQIEHDILRKMNEPRIHFAIVCASHSCPRLLAEAYTAKKLEDQLDRNARNFFANPENFRYDRQDKRFYLSSILKWFDDDFGPNQARQLQTIAEYLPGEAARQAARNNSVRISYMDYDWSLNDQK